jgi:hypothetical protein
VRKLQERELVDLESNYNLEGCERRLTEVKDSF